jgi:hypothetical protein
VDVFYFSFCMAWNQLLLAYWCLPVSISIPYFSIYWLLKCYVVIYSGPLYDACAFSHCFMFIIKWIQTFVNLVSDAFLLPINTLLIITEFELGRDISSCLFCLNANELQVSSLEWHPTSQLQLGQNVLSPVKVSTEETQFLCGWFYSSNFCDFFFPDDHEQHIELWYFMAVISLLICK